MSNASEKTQEKPVSAAETLNREELKKIFVTGAIPTEENFKQLIDSTVNSKADGFSRNDAHGMRVWPNERQHRYLSLFESVEADSEALFVEKGLPERPGVSFGTPNHPNILTFDTEGCIGIGTEACAAHTLDVNGAVGMKARVGTYPVERTFNAEKRTIPAAADGTWKTVLKGVRGCQAFEVMAKASGQATKGKYAIMHAIAVKAHANSRGRIKKTVSQYGWFWNRLSLRWHADKKSNTYDLEIRTRSHYGKGGVIEFTVCQLWCEDPAPQDSTPKTTLA